jgi:hypothetical protein
MRTDGIIIGAKTSENTGILPNAQFVHVLVAFNR